MTDTRVMRSLRRYKIESLWWIKYQYLLLRHIKIDQVHSLGIEPSTFYHFQLRKILVRMDGWSFKSLKFVVSKCLYNPLYLSSSLNKFFLPNNYGSRKINEQKPHHFYQVFFWTLNFQDQLFFSQYFLSQVCFTFCIC